MRKYMKTCMFLCFHVKFKHESTKTCTFSCIFFFNPHALHHTGKGVYSQLSLNIPIMPKAEATCFKPWVRYLLAEYLFPSSSMIRSSLISPSV